LAHMFEHLMFSGSRNIKNIDAPVQNGGGENNAFTNSDHTNYHEIFPAQNIELAFWIEADRMEHLTVSKKSLNTQKKVVIEEFKETTLDEPFGDVWHHLSEMVYESHPYRWPVIGLRPDHIAKIDLEDVNRFYKRYYQPNNAIIAVVGNVKTDQVKHLAEKWFGSIPTTPLVKRTYPKEKEQIVQKRKIIKGAHPAEAIYIAFRMGSRLSDDFYCIDLISDILSNGQSSRFYLNLLKQKRMFNSIDAFLSGTIDDGIFVIEGKLNAGISLKKAEEAIWEELELLKHVEIEDYELQKNKNQVESALVFSESGTLNKAINFCFYESIGQLNMINTEMDEYNKVTVSDIKRSAIELFQRYKSSVIWYEIH
jgi:zinc protease